MAEIDLTTAADDAGGRIDAVVAKRLNLPRASVQQAVKAAAIVVNGEGVRPSYRVAEGDRITGKVEVASTGLPEAEAIELDVRYEDDKLMVVCKPAGVVTHPGSGNQTGTLVNALLGSGRDLSSTDPYRPGIVHRLDKDTSGLLLVAKDDDTHAGLAAALKRREIRRTYLALVRGQMEAPSGSIEAPVGRHPVARRKMAVTPEGRDAVTHYSVLGEGNSCSYLEVRLETGRTHQIRVHLSHLGHPVLGDPLYGGRSELSAALGLERPFLHASELRFVHPATGEEVHVTADLPADLARSLELAGLTFHSEPS